MVVAAGPVLIDLPDSIGPDLGQIAVERCDAVLGADRCHLVEPSGENSAYSALVQARDPSFVEVRIELRRGLPGGPLLQSREISFSPADPLEDRLGSLGVLVAALVVLWESRSVDRPPAPEPKPAPRAHSEAPEPRLESAVDAGLFVSHGLDRPPVQTGPVLRVLLAYEPWRSFGLFGGRYARRFAAEPSLDWFSLDAGFGTRVGPWRGLWAIELHAEAEWQYLRVSATDEASGRSETTSTSRFGLRLGLDASWRVAPSLRVLLGFEGAVLRPEVLIDVRNAAIDHLGPVAVSGLAGIRFSP